MHKPIASDFITTACIDFFVIAITPYCNDFFRCIKFFFFFLVVVLYSEELQEKRKEKQWTLIPIKSFVDLKLHTFRPLSTKVCLLPPQCNHTIASLNFCRHEPYCRIPQLFLHVSHNSICYTKLVCIYPIVARKLAYLC